MKEIINLIREVIALKLIILSLDVFPKGKAKNDYSKALITFIDNQIDNEN